MNKQIIVLTPGRSGSSMVASMLLELGVFMGNVTRPPDDANPLGYFEDAEFIKLHQELLEDLPTPEPVFDAPLELLARMRTLVEQRNNQHQLWGFKNGEMSLTCHCWHRLFSNPQYIVVVRDPRAVVESFERAWGIDRQTSWANFAIYVGSIEYFANSKRVLRLEYDTTLDYPGTAQLIASFIGVRDESKIAAAQAVIRPEMRHIEVAHEA